MSLPLCHYEGEVSGSPLCSHNNAGNYECFTGTRWINGFSYRSLRNYNLAGILIWSNSVFAMTSMKELHFLRDPI